MEENMGQGIVGVIPVRIKKSTIEKAYLSKDYLDFYEVDTNSEQVESYIIKDSILVYNFRDFYTEYNDIIYQEEGVYENDFIKRYDEIKDINSFISILNEYEDTGRIPFYRDDYFAISVLGLDVLEYIAFYNGSYKAFLEVYNTLFHMEKLLSRAINNPLSRIVKFGIFG